MKRLLSRLLVAMSAGALFSPAGAHALLDSTVPAAGSTLHQSPTQLELRFTQRLEPAFSRVHVRDRSGAQVDDGDPQIDRADGTLLRVSLPRLAAGRYRVIWRVLSVDNHVVNGDFTFDVAP
jgi:copper resistance protein C